MGWTAYPCRYILADRVAYSRMSCIHALDCMQLPTILTCWQTGVGKVHAEQCLPILHCMLAVCGSGSIDVYTMYLLLLGAPTLCFTRCIASAWNEVQLQSMPCMHVSLSFPSRKNITFSGSHTQSTQGIVCLNVFYWTYSGACLHRKSFCLVLQYIYALYQRVTVGQDAKDNVANSLNDEYASVDHDPTCSPNWYAGGLWIN